MMDSNAATTILPVATVSMINVLQKDRHLWHSHILPTTSAIACGNPRCVAMVATAITNIAIPMHSITLLSD